MLRLQSWRPSIYGFAERGSTLAAPDAPLSTGFKSPRFPRAESLRGLRGTALSGKR